MAIALDANVSEQLGDGVVTLNHVANVQVIAAANCTGASGVTCTVGGTQMALLTSVLLPSSVTTLWVWALYRAAAANETITVSGGGAFSTQGAASFTGCTDTEPRVELLNTATSTGTAVTVTVAAGTTNRWVIQVIATESGSVTIAPGTGQTEIFDLYGTEMNYESSSTATVMDATISASQPWVTIAFGLLPSANPDPILTPPRQIDPYLRRFITWACTENYMIPAGSYYRVSLAKGAGTPSFLIRVPDPSGLVNKYVKQSDLVAGDLRTIYLYGSGLGLTRQLQFGLIERVSPYQYGPNGVETEITGREFGTALAAYSGNGQGFTNKEVNYIITNSTNGLMTSIPECGTESVALPGITTSSNPSAATTIDSSLNYLAGICTGETGDEWRHYFCGSVHANELKRDTLHFEKVAHNLSPFELRLEDSVDASETAWQVPWESQQLAESNITTKLEVGQATVEYSTAGAVVTTTLADRPVGYFQLAYTSTSAEATNYGTAITTIRGVPYQFINMRKAGTLMFVPSNNVYVTMKGNRTLMTIDQVDLHQWQQGFVADIQLSRRVT